jgi:GAF domain-containing protein
VNSSERWEQFADTARAMSTRGDLPQMLEEAVHAATELVEGCDHAGITIIHGRRRVTTDVATDDVVRRGDEMQYELGDGPCLQAIYEHETIHSDDLTREERWPRWSRYAAEELGVRSMLCLRLYTARDDTVGGLNLYGDRVRAFPPSERHTALALAAHVAVAYVAAHEHSGLESALATRTIIGQAEGMLMQRYSLTESQAFDVLRRHSQAENRKLHDVATELVMGGPIDGTTRQQP